MMAGAFALYLRKVSRKRAAGTQIAIALACALSATSFLPQRAHAQDDLLILPPVIPPDYDRGRNVSVNDRPRPDYDPLGVRVGGFNVYPSIRATAGFTDNVLQTDTARQSDGFVSLTPAVRAQSDWSRHLVSLRATGQALRYLDTPRRNQNSFDTAALGRYDVNSRLGLIAEGQLTRQFESPLTGGVNSDVAVLSSFLRSYLGTRAVYQFDRIRGTLALDRTGIAFSNVNLGDSVRNQSERDRVITRASAQFDFARTPSFAFFTRGTVSKIDYSRPMLDSGLPNRDSFNYRAIAGVTFDIPGRFRGSLGAGVSHQNYRKAIYDSITGLSAEGKIEYFPSELTTVTVSLARTIEDSNIFSTQAYYDNRLRGQVDHELLRNLILSAIAEVGHLDYVGSPLKTDITRFSGRARYLSSPLIEIETNLNYSLRDESNVLLNGKRKEFSAQLGIVIHR